MPKTQMLINYVPGEECRIAIARDGRLEEFYQERASAESHVGSIYKGKVTNVEPSIQAAFVDFGLERNGFLHISDLHPKYFPGKDREEFEQVGSKTPHRDRPPIQRCLRRGDQVLVQVLKEGIGTKGPTLTSYLSIPGRFLVMMPDMQRTGVSRKVDDDEARREMRKILDELNPPKEFGFIVRTAGIGQTKTELKRDLAYLQRLWKNLDRRRKQLKGTGELYAESDLVIRTIRDVYTADIERIIVDDPTAARRAYDFLAVASPRSRTKVLQYNDPVPLYHRFGIESQIESIHSRTVPLPSGGSLVIDQAEALVAIDVNSGKSREARDAETNAYRTNLEAVDEICRQLRLRDLGGVIINDLIDMRDAKHRRDVETRFRNNLKNDRARTRIGAISQFGILEMTRQRMRPSLNKSLYTHCAACAGTGHVKTAESVVLDVMRRLALAMHHKQVARIELTISPDVAFQLLNRKRGELVSLEERFEKPVMVRVGGDTLDYVNINAFDARGGGIDAEALGVVSDAATEPDEAFVELTGAPLPIEDEIEEQPAEEDEGPSDAEDAEAAERPAAADESQAEGEGGGKRRRRRRRRGGRGRRREGDEGAAPPQDEAEARHEGGDAGAAAARDADADAETREPSPAEVAEKAEAVANEESDEDGDASGEADGAEPQAQGEGQNGAARRRRRRRGGRRRNKNRNREETDGQEPEGGPNPPTSAAEPQPQAVPAAPAEAREPAAAPAPARAPRQPSPSAGRGYSNRLFEAETPAQGDNPSESGT